MDTPIIGGIPMSSPLILGAGVAKYPAHLPPYLHPDLPLGATVFGSLTLEDDRVGNLGQGTLSWPEDWTRFLEMNFGLNSFGMPNEGIGKSIPKLEAMEPTRPIVASVAGFNVEEFVRLIERANRSPVISAIEANEGCPNTGKTPFAFDLEATRALLERLKALVLGGIHLKPIWIKLSPYLTRTELDDLAAAWPNIDFSATPTVEPGFVEEIVGLIACYPFVKAIVFGNTLPNCRHLGPDGKPVTTPFEGRAGLSGPILKAINLRLLGRALDVITPRHLHFIACGGVLHGDDAYQYLYAGAAAVQCASGPAWYPNGPRFFVDLVTGSEPLQIYMGACFPS